MLVLCYTRRVLCNLDYMARHRVLAYMDMGSYARPLWAKFGLEHVNRYIVLFCRTVHIHVYRSVVRLSNGTIL